MDTASLVEIEKDKHISTCKIYWMVISACLGSLCIGIEIAVFNPIQDLYGWIVGWDSSKIDMQKGLITSFFPLGAAIGAFLAGTIGAQLGRRKTFLVGNMVIAIGSVLCCIEFFLAMFFGRVLIGIAVGLLTVSIPIYINEISPKHLSGLMGSMFMFAMNLGIFISFILGLFLPTKKDQTELSNFRKNFWKFMFAFPCLLSLLSIFLFWLVQPFETPYWLLSKERESEAWASIKNLIKKEYVDEEMNQIRQQTKCAQTASFKEIISKKYFGRLLIGIMLCVVQQLSGINAIIFQSTSIFTGDVRNPPHELVIIARWQTVGSSILLTISSYLTGVILGKFGRKTILLLGVGILAVALIFISIFSIFNLELASSITIMIYLFGFGISLGPIVWVYLPEILPDIGVSIASIVNWIFVFIVGLVFPIIATAIKIYGVFFIFGGIMTLSFFLIMWSVKETKGKSKKQIEILFEN